MPRAALIVWPSTSSLPAAAIDDPAPQDVERADEGGNEARARIVVDLERRADLLDTSLVHHHDAVRDRQRFFLIVGDVDRRDAELALDGSDLLAQRDADLGVERRQRFVQQQHLRLDGERAGERHALLLAARELEGIAPAELRQLDELQHLLDAAVISVPAFSPP